MWPLCAPGSVAPHPVGTRGACPDGEGGWGLAPSSMLPCLAPSRLGLRRQHGQETISRLGDDSWGRTLFSVAKMIPLQEGRWKPVAVCRQSSLRLAGGAVPLPWGRMELASPLQPPLLGPHHHCPLMSLPRDRYPQRPLTRGTTDRPEWAVAFPAGIAVQHQQRPCRRTPVCGSAILPCGCPAVCCPFGTGPLPAWGVLGWGLCIPEPRDWWLCLLSPDCRVLAGSWCGLETTPGTDDPQEAGGPVPDLE